VQPESRGKGWPLSRNVEKNERWDRATKGGLNGIIMILIALTWWYLSIRDEDDKHEFSLVLNDVSWVVGKLVTSAKHQKRSLDDETDSPRKR
jgi:hypothetical protein